MIEKPMDRASDSVFDFEKLKVYQKALDYLDFVYEVTRDFPKTEMYSLVDQYKRASSSICLNIAEGSGGTKIEFKRFLGIARRSVRECIAITEIAYRQKFMDIGQRARSRDYCFEISRMIGGLIKSLLNERTQNE